MQRLVSLCPPDILDRLAKYHFFGTDWDGDLGLYVWRNLPNSLQETIRIEGFLHAGVSYKTRPAEKSASDKTNQTTRFESRPINNAKQRIELRIKRKTRPVATTAMQTA
ncbi:hypothetical protein CHS0354_041713 [Potamilus streckersoni]|uniref:Uncharacterized protein n=1 Tax=Potamilus streckersoni TaxID=2493646 RepID=A0AAE0W4I9_9BIVA|nr:hypothetical protein CHS0354_041713 [Potamilus streckersoni]